MVDRLAEAEAKAPAQSKQSPKGPSTLQMTQLGSLKQITDEWTPLRAGNKDGYGRTSSSGKKSTVNDESLEFFPFILQEIDKVNKFFIGKLAELRIKLEHITSKRQNAYFSHHTSGESDLNSLRDIYVELAALRSYCDLNQTGLSFCLCCYVKILSMLKISAGFYKIIKKYDKVLEEEVSI